MNNDGKPQFWSASKKDLKFDSILENCRVDLRPENYQNWLEYLYLSGIDGLSESNP
tara:strand:+ start:680 stop:847 length:168 start_codon:yes stop_codon:yes gene_type:complete